MLNLSSLFSLGVRHAISLAAIAGAVAYLISLIVGLTGPSEMLGVIASSVCAAMCYLRLVRRMRPVGGFTYHPMRELHFAIHPHLTIPGSKFPKREFKAIIAFVFSRYFEHPVINSFGRWLSSKRVSIPPLLSSVVSDAVILGSLAIDRAIAVINFAFAHTIFSILEYGYMRLYRVCKRCETCPST